MIFKYIFYRVYRFYNRRWPQRDPDIYGFGAVAFGAIFWELALSMCFLSSQVKAMAEGRGKIVAIVIYLLTGFLMYYYLGFAELVNNIS